MIGTKIKIFATGQRIEALFRLPHASPQELLCRKPSLHLCRACDGRLLEYIHKAHHREHRETFASATPFSTMASFSSDTLRSSTFMLGVSEAKTYSPLQKKKKHDDNLISFSSFTRTKGIASTMGPATIAVTAPSALPSGFEFTVEDHGHRCVVRVVRVRM